MRKIQCDPKILKNYQATLLTKHANFYFPMSKIKSFVIPAQTSHYLQSGVNGVNSRLPAQLIFGLLRTESYSGIALFTKQILLKLSTTKIKLVTRFIRICLMNKANHGSGHRQFPPFHFFNFGVSNFTLRVNGKIFHRFTSFKCYGVYFDLPGENRPSRPYEPDWAGGNFIREFEVGLYKVR